MEPTVSMDVEYVVLKVPDQRRTSPGYRVERQQIFCSIPVELLRSVGEPMPRGLRAILAAFGNSVLFP